MPNQKNINSVKDLSDKISKAKSIYFTDFLGLNVSDVTILRKKFYSFCWFLVNYSNQFY